MVTDFYRHSIFNGSFRVRALSLMWKEEPELGKSSGPARISGLPLSNGARGGEAILSQEETSHQQLGDRKSQENQQARDWKGTKDFQRANPFDSLATSTVSNQCQIAF